MNYDKKQAAIKKAENQLLEAALKSAGRMPSGYGKPDEVSPKDQIQVLEAHVARLKDHRSQMQAAHGVDASDAVQKINHEIARTLRLIAKLKISTSDPNTTA